VEIFQIDEHEHLFIAPDLDDWHPISDKDITVVFDLDDDLDVGVPAIPGQLIYLYFPFEDKDLPDLQRLHALAQLGASMIEQGCRVLVHCGMGHNRSALLAGIILTYMGMKGEDAVALIQQKRRGALYNKVFAAYLMGLPSAHEQQDGEAR
jgi:protein-tyrosine phosphatase